MKSHRDTTRIVRSWLEDGSAVMPDRVLDAVMFELSSTPQRRSAWSPRRFLEMRFVVPVAAAAVVIVAAVAVGSTFLPAGPSVGGVADPTPSPVSGQFTFVLGDGEEVAVDVNASADGSTLSGRADVSYSAGDFTIELQCARMFDDQTWFLAGEIESASPGTQEVGTRMAIVVRDSSPQQVAIWAEDGLPAADCETFVSDIPSEAVDGPEAITPVKDGGVSLPAPEPGS